MTRYEPKDHLDPTPALLITFSSWIFFLLTYVLYRHLNARQTNLGLLSAVSPEAPIAAMQEKRLEIFLMLSLLVSQLVTQHLRSDEMLLELSVRRVLYSS